MVCRNTFFCQQLHTDHTIPQMAPGVTVGLTPTRGHFPNSLSLSGLVSGGLARMAQGPEPAMQNKRQSDIH
jgi:hypothetical protein